MGNFKGHALPGTFFFIMGLWWNTKCILKYACRKQNRTCYLSSKALLRRAEIWEGIVIIFMGLTGMAGEQFIAGGPYLALYKEGQWNQLLGWHHTTMYFFFGLQGVSHILSFTISSLPVSLSKLMLSNAIFVESFIFYNHTHGREMLDIFVHQMLVFVTILTGLVAFMEFLTKNNVLLELLRTNLIMLQGTWFWQIGLFAGGSLWKFYITIMDWLNSFSSVMKLSFAHSVLVLSYTPSGGPAWNLEDHDNKLFLTICLCWHYASTFIITGVNYAFITWLVKSRLKRVCPSEVGLLKNADREQESEEEV